MEHGFQYVGYALISCVFALLNEQVPYYLVYVKAEENIFLIYTTISKLLDLNLVYQYLLAP